MSPRRSSAAKRLRRRVLRARSFVLLVLMLFSQGACSPSRDQAGFLDSPDRDDKLWAQEVLSRVRRAVVYVETRKGHGSGAIVHPCGLILTASHVIAGNQARVRLEDGTWVEARVILDNPINDFAVLRARVEKPLAALEIATTCRANDPVLLLGAGASGVHFSAGRVFARAMNLPSTDRDSPDQTGEEYYHQAILHTALGHHGDSGGPLVDLSGHLIGINAAIAEREFTVAVPTGPFKLVLDELTRYQNRRALEQAKSDAQRGHTAPPPNLRALIDLTQATCPGSVTEEIDWTLEGLREAAGDLYPERASAILDILPEVRQEGLDWSSKTHSSGRVLFERVWKLFFDRLRRAQ